MNMNYVSLCSLCALSFVVAAQETGRHASMSDTSPADMHPGINPWGGAIEFPAGSDDVEMFLRCQGQITEAGQLEGVYCDVARLVDGGYIVNAPEDWPYANAIYRATEPVRVTPARIEGQRQAVMTVFSFVFARERGKETITLFQNHLLNRDQSRSTFVAPQIYERERPGLRFCIMPKHDALHYRVRIDGTADVTVMPRTDRRQDCVDRSLAHQGFIPAKLDGQPIEAMMEIIRRRPDRRLRDPNLEISGRTPTENILDGSRLDRD